MRHTLATLRGSISSRLVSPEMVPKGAIDDAINQAVQEVYLHIRANHNRKVWGVVKLNLRADEDTYDLPLEVGDVTKVERSDISGGNGWTVVVPHDYLRDDEPGMVGSLYRMTPSAYSYSINPGRRLRLNEMPQTDTVNGLRLTFHPRPVPMQGLDDVPQLPEEIHEVVVAQALARLSQHRTVQFAAPRAVEKFIQRQDQVLLDFLTPSDLDRAPQVEDRDEHYREV